MWRCEATHGNLTSWGSTWVGILTTSSYPEVGSFTWPPSWKTGESQGFIGIFYKWAVCSPIKVGPRGRNLILNEDRRVGKLTFEKLKMSNSTGVAPPLHTMGLNIYRCINTAIKLNLLYRMTLTSPPQWSRNNVRATQWEFGSKMMDDSAIKHNFTHRKFVNDSTNPSRERVWSRKPQAKRFKQN